MQLLNNLTQLGVTECRRWYGGNVSCGNDSPWCSSVLFPVFGRKEDGAVMACVEKTEQLSGNMDRRGRSLLLSLTSTNTSLWLHYCYHCDHNTLVDGCQWPVTSVQLPCGVREFSLSYWFYIAQVRKKIFQISKGDVSSWDRSLNLKHTWPGGAQSWTSATSLSQMLRSNSAKC